MEQNVGGLDRTVRLVAGPVLAVLGLVMVADVLPGGQVLGALLVLVGAVLLVTGITRRCVINSVLGVDTRSRG